MLCLAQHRTAARRILKQRITVVKIGGVAADIIVDRFRTWSGARDASDPNLWSPEQWPGEIRGQVDELANQVRLHAATPPVIHYSEWMDLWSSGDTFGRWLSPPNEPNGKSEFPCVARLSGPYLFGVHAYRFEAYAYSLPDSGRLAAFLADTVPQQFRETDTYIHQLRSVVAAWDQLVHRAVVLVLREVMGGTALDEEIVAALTQAPNWLIEEMPRGGQPGASFDWGEQSRTRE